MKNVLVTGARGFIGRNLCAALRRMEWVLLQEFDLGSTGGELDEALNRADVIFHLAGVNRPQHEEEFRTGNTGSTEELCTVLHRLRRIPKIVLSSSIQADMDNPYGASKRGAEEVLRKFGEETGAECVVHRFKNLFGKWCRPNYNSVTATFCYNIAHGLPIHISDPSRKLELTYIDDVVEAFISDIQPGPPGFRFAPPLAGTWITLSALAEKIQAFRDVRSNPRLPDFSSAFERALYATYLGYLENDEFGYSLDVKSDRRGSLAEFLKSAYMGQIFISRTLPGVTRGDHYHHTKTEKFFVVEGEAIIRFRHIESDHVIEYHVAGEDYRVLDIPPGYTHSIENVGHNELVTLFWASQMFDPEHGDTHFDPVLKNR
jgi:UDP-2-acetamido-2,6-beta-L-arabino-hexul-4-ose reductase